MPTFTPPPAAYSSDLFPRPFLDGRDDWIRVHDLAWKQAHAHIGHEPSLAAPWYMDEACMPDRVWQWDTCFMALYTFWAPGVFPGMESLDNFYAWQKEDGFIAMCTLLASGEPAYGVRINPPLFAWVEWLYYRHTGDDSRLARVLPVLVKYFGWLKANRRRPRIVHPSEELDASAVSTRDSEGLYWATAAGAMGMDNAPRATHLGWNGGEIAWIDLSAQQVLAARHIAKIAAAVGDAATARRFDGEARELSRLINLWMWCERDQFYHDIFLDGNFLSCKTVAGFWPLLAGVATQSQAEGLLAHLRNPSEFWRKHPVPSLSADDPNYEPSGGYWLGGVWAPCNAMVLHGLRAYGFHATAHDLAVKHLDGLSEVLAQHEPATIWEAYAPDVAAPSTNKTRRKLVRPDFCGWSALGATSLFYEFVLGVSVDAVAGELHWRLQRPEVHGIEALAVGAGRVDLRAEAAGDPDAPRAVEISTTVDLRVTVERVGERHTAALSPGRHKINF